MKKIPEFPPVVNSLIEATKGQDESIIPMPFKTILSEPVNLYVRRDWSVKTAQTRVLQLCLGATRPSYKILLGVRDWKFSNLSYAADGNFSLNSDIKPSIPDELSIVGGFRYRSEGLCVNWQTFNGLLPKDPEYANDLIKERLAPPENEWDKELYRRKGYASLLIVLSLYFLWDAGVTALWTTEVSKGADKLWRKFGRTSSLNEVDGTRYSHHKEIRQMMRNPYIASVLLRHFGNLETISK